MLCLLLGMVLFQFPHVPFIQLCFFLLWSSWSIKWCVMCLVCQIFTCDLIMYFTLIKHHWLGMKKHALDNNLRCEFWTACSAWHPWHRTRISIIIDNFCIGLFSGLHKLTVLYNILSLFYMSDQHEKRRMSIRINPKAKNNNNKKTLWVHCNEAENKWATLA